MGAFGVIWELYRVHMNISEQLIETEALGSICKHWGAFGSTWEHLGALGWYQIAIANV